MADKRFISLDGWRGISILLVLATHLLPLGPKILQINSMTAAIGMALFFSLSGFLMTTFLLHNSSITDFLIRRFFRIIPLAWLYIAIALFLAKSTPEIWMSHLFFYANWPPMRLLDVTAHLWSLCVEIQFYIGIALLVRLLSKRGLLLIPIICIAVTTYRYTNNVYIAINTYYRIDEILSGSCLALLYNYINNYKHSAVKIKLFNPLNQIVISLIQLVIFLLFLVSCHPEGQWMNYFRPYLAATLVGTTLLNSNTKLSKLLDNRFLVYVATISYALYIIHPILGETWLGEGDKIIKYSKRPLFFLALFILAHISTFYFEKKFINLGKKFSAILVTRKS